MPIRQKILLYVFALLLIPFFFLGYIQSSVSFREIEKNLSENTQQMLKQVELATKFYISEMTQILYLAEQSESVQAFLHGDDSIETTQEIFDYLKILKSSNSAVQGAMVFEADDNYISLGLQKYSRDPLSFDVWHQYAIANPNKLIFISNPIGRNLVNDQNYDTSQTISAIKALTEEDGSTVGILLFDFSLQELENRITPVMLGSEGFFYVVDQRGDIIYAPLNKIVHRIENRDILFGQQDKVIVEINNRLYQVMANPIETNNWSIIGVFEYDDITEVFSKLTITTIIIFVLTLIFAFILSKIFDRILVNPITNLQSLMKQAEGGNLSVTFEKGNDDEIGKLGNSFNKMISEIKKLLNIVEQKESQKRKAELQVLQEQIKPHFLYNTLDTISWMAIEANEHEIYKMVNALSEFFRISLNEGREFITLEQELNHIKNYLVIQCMRYEKTFQYDFDVDEKLLNTSIIKLILQPLIENAIYHGIKEKGEFGEIHIKAFQSGDDIEIHVRDNGKGITEEKFQKLSRMFESSPLVVGYGLSNVNQRLKYHFGDSYHLRIVPNEDGGVTAIVKHPLTKTIKR